jgi:type I restriction enzyme S subunit
MSTASHRFNEVSIGEFCQTGSGGTPARSNASRYFGGSIPWVKSGELRETVITETEECITEEGLAESSAKLLPVNTLLVALYGATVGRIGVLGVEAATNQAVCYIIPDEHRADRQYLYYALQSKVPVWLSQRVGGGQPNISQGIIRDTSIPLPPLPEQKRIANILDKANTIRRKRQEANSLLDDYPHSLFRDMFGHPDKNPLNWPIHQFDDVAESRLGKMLDAKQQTGKHLRPYMRNLNVQWGKLDLSEVFEMDFGESHREEFRLQFGDVLICEGGAGVGQTAIWRDELPECYFQKSLHRVRPYSDKATPEFIAFLMWTLMKGSSLLGSISSATIPHLTGVKLKQIQIPVPPMKLQQEFQRQIHTYNRVREHGRVAHAETDALFNTMVQRAFKGEL